MLGPADASAASVALLTIQAENSSWALPCAAVSSVQTLDARAAETALDVLALLGVSASPAFEAWRVVVLRVSGEDLPLLVRGALGLHEMPTRDVLPLPAALARASPFVTHVALAAGKPTRLVLSPERLLHAYPARAGSPSPTFTTSP